MQERPPTTAIAQPQLIPLTTVSARAVGSRQAGDYDRTGGIDLEVHIKGLADPAIAAPLAAVLRTGPVKAIAAAYNADNSNAIRRQRWFKWLGRVAMWAAFLATITGALYLFPVLGVRQMPQLRSALVLSALVCLVTMFLASRWLRWRQSGLKFMGYRAKAELNRFKLFAAVLQAAPQGLVSTSYLLALKLEYFRRFLMEDQVRYYIRRGTHAKASAANAKRLSWVGDLVYLMVFIAALPAILVLLDQGGFIPWAAFQSCLQRLREYELLLHFSQIADKYLLGVAVVTAAVHTLLRSRSRLELDERNAARYGAAAAYLADQANAPLEAARLAAEAGQGREVAKFVADITAELGREHAEWCWLHENMWYGHYETERLELDRILAGEPPGDAGGGRKSV